MRRSTEFDVTIRHGSRAAQPDLVVHLSQAHPDGQGGDAGGPRFGLVIPKSVGTAVDRHRVARRLRHVARNLVTDLSDTDRVVIRALPGSRTASSARLSAELRRGLRRAAEKAGTER